MLGGVIVLKPDRPYFESWLRRAGRHFAVSGSLSQAAVVLAREEGGTPEEWRTRLRTVLDGNEVPSLDLLTRIDALLAGSAKPGTERTKNTPGASQGTLF